MVAAGAVLGGLVVVLEVRHDAPQLVHLLAVVLQVDFQPLPDLLDLPHAVGERTVSLFGPHQRFFYAVVLHLLHVLHGPIDVLVPILRQFPDPRLQRLRCLGREARVQRVDLLLQRRIDS